MTTIKPNMKPDVRIAECGRCKKYFFAVDEYTAINGCPCRGGDKWDRSFPTWEKAETYLARFQTNTPKVMARNGWELQREDAKLSLPPVPHTRKFVGRHPENAWWQVWEYLKTE